MSKEYRANSDLGIGIKIELDWEALGRELGHEPSDNQAALLTSMAYEIYDMDDIARSFQVKYITDSMRNDPEFGQDVTVWFLESLLYAIKSSADGSGDVDDEPDEEA